MFRRTRRTGDSTTNNNQELDLKLNLSPPTRRVGAPSAAAAAAAAPGARRRVSMSSPEGSPPRSCLSSEETLKYSSSPETTSMVLVGCPRCLMYVMLSEADPRCPKCKSTVLLDFQNINNYRDNDNRNNNNLGGRRN